MVEGSMIFRRAYVALGFLANGDGECHNGGTFNVKNINDKCFRELMV